MIKLSNIIALLFLIFCLKASAVDDANLILHNGRYVEKELLPYVIAFEREYGCPSQTSVRFERMTLLRAGTCYFFTNEVYINSYLWSNYTEEQKESLIFHELGHCALLIYFHRDKMRPIEAPYQISPILTEAQSSIMNSYIFHGYMSAYYKANRQYYLDELFGDKRNKCRGPLTLKELIHIRSTK